MGQALCHVHRSNTTFAISAWPHKTNKVCHILTLTPTSRLHWLDRWNVCKYTPSITIISTSLSFGLHLHSRRIPSTDPPSLWVSLPSLWVNSEFCWEHFSILFYFGQETLLFFFFWKLGIWLKDWLIWRIQFHRSLVMSHLKLRTSPSKLVSGESNVRPWDEHSPKSYGTPLGQPKWVVKKHFYFTMWLNFSTVCIKPNGVINYWILIKIILHR